MTVRNRLEGQVMDQVKPVIRDAEFADIEEMTKLLQELFSIEADFQFKNDVQQRGLKMLLDGCGKHRCVRVAIMEGRVVGMASIQTLISTAEGGLAGVIEDLVVSRTMRGRGIGPKLLSSLEAWAIQRGIQRIQLLADKDNLSGLNFYSQQNWQETRLICLRKRV